MLKCLSQTTSLNVPECRCSVAQVLRWLSVLRADFGNSLMMALFLLNKSCSSQELECDVGEDA